MRKIVLSLAVVGAMVATAVPAMAAVNISYQPGVTVAVGGTQQVLPPFGAVGTNSNVFTIDEPNQGKRPIGTVGNYLAAGSTGAGSYTLNLSAAAPRVSFLLGTLDTYNSIILTFASGPAQTLNGIGIIGGSAFGVTGTAFQDGLVTYDIGNNISSNFIKSITFSSSTAALEVANISAAPEPGTWLMMILGFGLVGAGLRSSRRRRGNPALA